MTDVIMLPEVRMWFVGTLVPANSLAVLHQLLLHDSNKNRSEVIVSGDMSSQGHDSQAQSLSVGHCTVPESFSGSLSTLLTNPSTQQRRVDEHMESWPTRAQHLSMPSIIDFL